MPEERFHGFRIALVAFCNTLRTDRDLNLWRNTTPEGTAFGSNITELTDGFWKIDPDGRAILL
jgi:hypothetical protein